MYIAQLKPVLVFGCGRFLIVIAIAAYMCMVVSTEGGGTHTSDIVDSLSSHPGATSIGVVAQDSTSYRAIRWAQKTRRVLRAEPGGTVQHIILRRCALACIRCEVCALSLTLLCLARGISKTSSSRMRLGNVLVPGTNAVSLSLYGLMCQDSVAVDVTMALQALNRLTQEAGTSERVTEVSASKCD